MHYRIMTFVIIWVISRNLIIKNTMNGGLMVIMVVALDKPEWPDTGHGSYQQYFGNHFAVLLY